MRQIGDMTMTPHHHGDAPQATLCEKHVKRLWERMRKANPRWISVYGQKDDGTWLLGLQGLTPEQIGNGIERYVRHGVIRNGKAERDWPPSLPEFRAMCEPSAEDLGLPSAEEAYRLATIEVSRFRARWSNAVVYATAREFGLRRLSEMPYAMAWPEWRDVYARIVQCAAAGHEFELPKDEPRAQAIGPRMETVERSIEQARAHLGVRKRGA